MNNDFFMHFILESIPRIYLNKSWLINTWYPPLKTIAKSLVYWVTFNAAPFRVLSWLTDNSLPWFNYWKTAVWRNYGEGPLCRIDTTISSSAKQQSFWFNITIESVVLLLWFSSVLYVVCYHIWFAHAHAWGFIKQSFTYRTAILFGVCSS